jgi:hypothetical protein
MHEEPVTRPERLFYMSTNGSMLFVGSVTSPIVARMAGVLASDLPALAVKDIKTMNAAIRRLKANLPAVAELHYKTPDLSLASGKGVLLVFTDASFNEDVSRKLCRCTSDEVLWSGVYQPCTRDRFLFS